MQLAYRELDADIVKRTNAIFPAQDCFVEVLPDRLIIPRKYVELGESIRQLPIYEDDVWMISYPRTGSTWAQEMVWLLGNQLDYEAAKQQLSQRSPMIELSALFSTDHHKWVSDALGNTVELVRNSPRPRFARSHLSWQLLPQQFESVKPKIVYTARNPKDLCVSYYHYCKLLHGINGDFDQFVELFLGGHTPMGSYWKHVLPFWKRSYDDNVLFIKYEDMIKDLPAVVRRCAQFLNVAQLLNEDSLKRICDHLQFDSMRGNAALNLEKILPQPGTKFIRNGKIGDWRNHMTDEMSARFDAWSEEHLRGSGLTFDYD
ncbi:luciferin sulfotransferase [Drosophila nasuta]|uniref:Luciferin sulfotransferase n=1 Tax=Drosophila albomicans TaxID=7291 RepID=A0A6P8XVR4_DROAB|nr:luciferin sulfotransferase [Drosophila albomicans]XP_060650704.1 luciferin sulfotransferase [Drosophila nasuta]